MDWLGAGNSRRQFTGQDVRRDFEKSALRVERSAAIQMRIVNLSGRGDKDVQQVAAKVKLQMPK